MLFLLYISGGLFLGWSLGSNDAANIFGSAVGAKMVSFKRAAWIASVFVIIGAVFQGKGGAETLNALGAVDALAGGFTVTVSAALTVFLMTRKALPVSTSQAVVGGIIGWTLFTGNEPDQNTLWKIVSTWVSGPILGALFAALLYKLMRFVLRKSKIHVIKLDALIRISLILAGAFGAYSLGANNIANIMGVFISAAPDVVIDFGLFALDGIQLLFLIGGLAIAVGIFTYSERVMNTIGNGILSLSAEAAIVVVLSQALVLFLFSSASLSGFLNSIGLPALPLVPVSSTQVVIGSVLGIGLIKGTQEIKTRVLASVALGWITTPIAAGIITYFSLFFIQNVFNLQVSSLTQASQPFTEHIASSNNGLIEYDLIIPGIIVFFALIISILIYIVFYQQRKRLKTENQLLSQQNESYNAQKALTDLEITAIQNEKETLRRKLESKRKEFIDAALNLSEQREFLETILNEINSTRQIEDGNKVPQKLLALENLIKQRMSFKSEKEDFYGQIEQVHRDFLQKLETSFPDLTDNEKRLAAMLRLSLPGKEIATLMNISPKSVEIARYRLKKKLGLSKDENLINFINNL
ncbi:MAG: inorganic phosphate transporter [Bacteroidales bacterium]|nr:inorganic phosphate transporter [Bacteroidales bacterium]MDD4086459.1 inorganic phosphate transporter [Bacteroidales bacterium]MDY0086740.1 inorganic phosphate transporter [Bacteroidales bacterium]